ncbi:UNVERIFIED_CONTAM: List-Bact-rpt repeat protein [Acetivibrio alkalicellulosi]
MGTKARKGIIFWGLLALIMVMRVCLVEASINGEIINENVTLSEDKRITGNLEITNGTLNLNGYSLKVEGDLIQNGGTVNINGGELEVQGDYRIGSEDNYVNGILRMTNEMDRVWIGGSFITYSINSHSGSLTAGTMEIKGDFIQGRNNIYSTNWNFVASGSHKVILSGEDEQTVSFQSPGTSTFNILEIKNKSEEGIKFESALPVRDIILNGYKTTDLPLWAANFTLKEDKEFNGDLNLKGGTLNLGEYSLIVRGDLVLDEGMMDLAGGDLLIDGKIIVNGGTLNLNGSKLTLEGKDLIINGGTINLNKGKLEVEGDLIQGRGTVNINGGELEVEGDYIIGDEDNNVNGILRMTNEMDRVWIGGSFITYSISSHSGSLTAGTMEIKGDFIQGRNNIYSTNWNFIASGTHKVILSGEDEQTVSFQSPGTSTFNILEIKNKSEEGIKFESALPVRDIILNGYKTTELPLWAANFTLKEDKEFNGDLNLKGGTLNLGEYSLIVRGDLVLDEGMMDLAGGDLLIDGKIIVNGGTLNLNGSRLTLEGKDLIINGGTINLNKGKLEVEGDLIQDGGTVNINGGELEVEGDYKIGNEDNNVYGLLNMTNEMDRVWIGGSFITYSINSHNFSLTAGTMEIKGDFIQGRNNIYSTNWNFIASGTHKVILSGKEVQTVSFQSPGISKFNILCITKPFETGYNFTNDVEVWVTLKQCMIDWPKSILEVTVSGNGFVKMNDESLPSNYKQEHNQGANIILTAVTDSGAEFAYWEDVELKRIISDNPVYEFVMGTDESVRAVFNIKDEERFSVIFKNKSGSILKSAIVEKNSAATPPEDPFITGYDFVGWDKDFSNVDSDMIVSAVFKRLPDTYIITVAGGKLSTGDMAGEYQFDMPVRVIADAPPSGMKFSHWEQDGIKISNDINFSFFMPKRDTALVAFYVDSVESISQEPFISISEKAIIDTEGKTIMFTANRNVTKGYSLVESGVILLKSDVSLEDTITLETENILRGRINNNSTDQFHVRKMNVEKGEIWYARAYIIYEDSRGNINTSYSEITAKGEI